jgi:hypothetical protein
MHAYRLTYTHIILTYVHAAVRYCAQCCLHIHTNIDIDANVSHVFSPSPNYIHGYIHMHTCKHACTHTRTNIHVYAPQVSTLHFVFVLNASRTSTQRFPRQRDTHIHNTTQHTHTHTHTRRRRHTYSHVYARTVTHTHIAHTHSSHFPTASRSCMQCFPHLANPQFRHL